MTLNEYLNQTDPIRKPIVLVNEEEIQRGVHTKLTGFTSIWIEGIPTEYILHEKSGVIYTNDGDGNPGNVTVFRINKVVSISREKEIHLPL